MEDKTDVTRMLLSWSSGTPGAEEALFPIVYDELKRIARRYIQQERQGHTLQPTALVNEAYLRLIDATHVTWQNRAQFYGVAATMMRRILVNHAREHCAAKRGGRAPKLPLEEVQLLSTERPEELVALDDALNRLGEIYPRKSQVVELKFFGGLSVEEIAALLNVSEKTVLRDWNFAKLWLYREVAKGGSEDNLSG